MDGDQQTEIRVSVFNGIDLRLSPEILPDLPQEVCLMLPSAPQFKFDSVSLLHKETPS
jgi:hypothetical protein